MSSELQKPFVDKPYVLDEPTQKAIVAALVEGNYLYVACEAAGTTYSCFRHWRNRYEEGDPVAQVFADFFTAVKKALATAEADGLVEVRKGEAGWQGSAWFLERRFPKRWGKKVMVEHKGLPEDISKLSDEQLEAISRGKGRRRT